MIFVSFARVGKTQRAASPSSYFGQYRQSSWNGSSAQDDSGSGAASTADQSWRRPPRLFKSVVSENVDRRVNATSV